MQGLWVDCSRPRPEGQPPGVLWGTYPGGSGYHAVGEDKEVQADQLEDVFEEVNDLQSQHVLRTEKMRGKWLASSCSHDPEGPCPAGDGGRREGGLGKQKLGGPGLPTEPRPLGSPGTGVSMRPCCLAQSSSKGQPPQGSSLCGASRYTALERPLGLADSPDLLSGPETHGRSKASCFCV